MSAIAIGPSLPMGSPSLARFFVVLLPPPDVQDEITAIKQEIWQRFGSRAALNAPPHITLQPPFQWPLQKLSDLGQCLESWAQRQCPLAIELEGYGVFAPRVIYIDVVQTPELMALQPALMAHLEEHCGIDSPTAKGRPFIPHLTVGFRDLTPAAFGLAWAEFEQRPFAAEFVASKLALLRHDGQNWHIYSEFSLNSSIP